MTQARGLDPNPLISQLSQTLKQRQFDLPTLPEVPMKVRRLVDDPNSSLSQLVRLLSADPVLTGRMILRANSALYGNLPPVRTLQGAIERLGFIPTRNLVISLTMSKIYQVRGSELVRTKLAQQWKYSTQVAALCQVFAKHAPHLDHSEALLAGLLHNIGALPVIMTYARRNTEQELSSRDLDRLIEPLYPELGGFILREWKMPDVIAEVAEHHLDVQREHEGLADYLDVVVIAGLHAYRGSNHPLGRVPHWMEVPAFTKLGLTPDDSIEATRIAYKEIQSLQQMLR
ncbi:MAG: HDOD domain-containing protein [Gammaproteobacteria bacterium]|nr:HDOD domain-containing protein [Gammaproteobacteria bacterium]